MNRGISNTILHDPTKDPAPTPFTPPPAWNRRLIAVHGTGCPTGWYRQGGAMGVSPLSVARLGQGYAMFTNTLNHPTNSCNAFLAGETTMMGKEHFVEEFGVPLFTVSMGTSGGVYEPTSRRRIPGLFDGVIITATFPDALAIATAGLDAHLLSHYFETSGPAALGEAQKVAISGYKGMKAFIDAANQAQRTDPVPDAGFRVTIQRAGTLRSGRFITIRDQSRRETDGVRRGEEYYGVDPPRDLRSGVRQRRRPVRTGH
jgi:hypothetical protein